MELKSDYVYSVVFFNIYFIWYWWIFILCVKINLRVIVSLGEVMYIYMYICVNSIFMLDRWNEVYKIYFLVFYNGRKIKVVVMGLVCNF